MMELAASAFFTKKENIIIYSGSGTLGMEGVIASLIEKGDKVLVLVNGYFGERAATIAEIYGAKVERLTTPRGKSIDPNLVEEKLSNGGFKALLVTHVETTNGVYNDVKELAKIAKREGVLTFVDTVSSLGGAPFRFDEEGYDVAFTGSQKCIAAPPGATLIALSERAQETLYNRKSPVPSYYFNLKRWMKVMKDPRVYVATPSIPILRALRVALKLMLEEGMENRWKRHEEVAGFIKDRLNEIGLKVVAERSSPTVTAVELDRPIAKEVQRYMLDKYDVLIATGIAGEATNVLRIGHMGIVTLEMAHKTVDAIEEGLKAVRLKTNRS